MAMDAEPMAQYLFQSVTFRLVPYTGPLHKIRPFLKWLAIAYLVVVLGISTLILKEQSLEAFLGEALLPATAIAWLVHTRARWEEFAEPAEIYFYPTFFALVKPETPVREWGREVFLRDVFSMDYNEVEKISYNLGIEQVAVVGRLHSAFFNYCGEARTGVLPTREKTVNGAAAFWYTSFMDPALNEEILERLSQYTGKEITRFGHPRMKSTAQE